MRQRSEIAEGSANQKFWIRQDPFSPRAVRVSAPAVVFGEVRERFFGNRTNDEPVDVEVDSGAIWMDVVWWSGVPLLHSRLIQILRGNGMAGFEEYKVSIHGKEGQDQNRRDDYCGVEITGRCRTIRFDATVSRRVVRAEDGYSREFLEGVWIDASDWDGSDLFLASDLATSFVGVTDRLRALFERAHVTNVEFNDPAGISARYFPSLNRQQRV